MHTQSSYKNQAFVTIVFVFLTMQPLLFSQSHLTIDWEKKIVSNSGFQKAILNNEGDIVAVGSTMRSNGKDIALSIITQNGLLLKDTVIVVGFDDDVINAIVQTDDGGYLMAGYTQSSIKGHQGKQDALLIKTDEKLRPLWHKLYGTVDNDRYDAIVSDTEGDGFYIAGIEDNNFTLTRIDNNGNKITAKTIKTTNVKAATLLYNKDKSRLFWVGVAEKKNQSVVYCFDKEYNEIWEKTYLNAQLNAAILDKTGKLLLTGMTFSQRTFEDMLLLVADPSNGEELSRKSFGNNGADVAQSIVQNTEGGIYLAGFSTSKTRGEKYEDICMVALDTSDAKKTWQNVIYQGGKTEDVAEVMLIAPNGSLVIAGRSDKKGWIASYDKIQTLKPDTYSLILSEPLFNDADVNGVLNQDERAYASFFIENKGTDTVGNISIVVKQIEGNEPIIFPKKLVVNNLQAGEKKRITLPFSSPNLQLDSIQLATNSNGFSIAFENDASKSKVIRFSTMKKPEPQLVIKGYSFGSINNAQLQRKIVTTLTVFIQNIGDTIAEAINIQCFLPKKVEEIGDKRAFIAQIQKGEQGTVEFKFKLETNFTESLLKAMLVVDGNNVKRNAPYYATVPVQSFEAYEQEQQKSSISKTNIIWLNPDPVEMRSTVVRADEPKYSIKVRAESTHPLTDKDFKIIINGEPLMGGAKLDNVKLKPDAQNQTNNYRYNFTTTVDLIGDTTKVEVEVENKGGKKRTEPLYFVYDSKPNLYILAIGVPDNRKRLKYPPKDAADLAAAFSKQKGILFKNVTVNLLNTEVNTTAKNLGGELADLTLKFSENEIRSQDVLMIIISSHGQIFEDRNKEYFRLLASDYSSMNPIFTTIDFERDILNQTEKINCKKLLFIDACNSGALVEAKSVSGEKSSKETPPYEAIQQLMKAKAGLRFLMSSKGDEKSYEDDEWKNGAFTKAILEALNNELMPTKEGKKRAYKDKQNVLSFLEMAEYLKARVPYLVKEKKKRDQNPVSALNGSDDFPIYLLKK